MNSSERKKQTHLRCERQRREAINSGYSELKDLLPASASFTGCKTTNAAILFRVLQRILNLRAADYVKSLDSTIEKNEEELSKLQTQFAALEMILQQYENFSFDSQTTSVLQLKMLQSFLDKCFESFLANVDVTNYKSLTSSLLMWIERLDFQNMSDALLKPAYKI
ncbi:BHLH domain-containing protein [Meloidogyne graminicola]|uniref:BHLH domain-containing protein n=1 Tax=Meloidogyne graminicola TaxID=189291 RepID=A0A8S9Z7J6_9BILA|nr:BHLH domain-containing protein [Meloidogyne graminicola]